MQPTPPPADEQTTSPLPAIKLVVKAIVQPTASLTTDQMINIGSEED